MRNLPFVVEPRRKPELIRVGNEDIGIFEIERRGYLTVTEKAGFQQVVTNKEGSRVLRDLVKLIAEDQKMSADKAGELVSKVIQAQKLSAKEEKIMEGYTLQLLDVLEVFRRETVHTQMIMATILLISRVDPSWAFEDTAGLDISVIEQLAELFQAEDAKSLEKLSFTEEKAVSPATEEPGKPQPQPEDHS